MESETDQVALGLGPFNRAQDKLYWNLPVCYKLESNIYMCIPLAET